MSTATDNQDEDDLALDHAERCLPAALRREWVVVPRRLLLQLFLLGLLMGSAVALYVMGKIYDVEALRWTIPVALIAPMLAVKLSPWWRAERPLRDLRKARREAEAAAGDAATR
ncbi:MAG: hypothetical protein NXI31_22315 [bacterium]|nr:hypothetical protein [bacterium]